MSQHIPVLLELFLQYAKPAAGDRLLDATVGHGGHARAFLQATSPDGTVLGLDADAAALEQARERLAPYKQRVTLIHSNFARLKDSVIGGGILSPPKVDHIKPDQPTFSHILFDLGIGSHQLSDAQRGFSFTSTAPLSMIYGDQTGLPPSQVAPINEVTSRIGELPDVLDLLQYLSADELAEVIFTYGEERYRGRIAQALKVAPLPQTAHEVAKRVAAAVPGRYRHGRIHPATRTFQALRLAVNRELEALQVALPQALELLEPGGRLLVISFHSLEDRIVKNFLRDQKNQQQVQLLTKKPITASEQETETNPRARSAKMRVAIKI